MTTLIRLTIKEAIRRRFFIGVLLVSLLFIGIMCLPHSFERRGRGEGEGCVSNGVTFDGS